VHATRTRPLVGTAQPFIIALMVALPAMFERASDGVLGELVHSGFATGIGTAVSSIRSAFGR
jgi:hypothetical protein